VEDWFYVGSAPNRENGAVTSTSELSFAF
jgi:hypothetical protein